MIKELHTERLILRKMNESDAPNLFKIWSDPAVTKYMDIDCFIDEDQAIEMIKLMDELSQDHKAIRYSIIEKESDVIIGTCGYNYFDWDNGRTEVGYDIAKDYWGKGYATEAIGSLVDYAFTTLKLNRIQAKVVPANVGSAKVLEKLNFTFEGTLRQYEKVNDTFNDLNMYARLATD
ncbi:GNAT family N-acetyltransferase [Paenibacillus sp. N1-5-1-14]|uniref:GNAT family N-acetyltransferase n=1 Tax=Paenibacillus radicibacter TaxID=2972488 RepID=UPI002159542A|nr:GNAT family N-acetyltransferase [Paenibacillus radicibacter]MCR8643403.1 GNAT family N-acetyltransferase [Paenibacillus radicibacter]